MLAASDSEALTRALIALVRRGTSCLALQSTRNTAERANAADHGSFSRSGALHDLLLLSMADSFVGSVSTFSHLVAEQTPGGMNEMVIAEQRAAQVAVLSCVVCPGQLSEPRGRGAWCAAMRRVAVRGYRGLRTFRAC